MSIVLNYLSQLNRRRLRAVLRGYEVLKTTNKLALVQNIKDQIAATELINGSFKDTKSLYGIKIESFELVVRQYLLHHLIYRVSLNNYFIPFTANLLFSYGSKNSKFAYPIPSNWMKVISDRGIKVNYFLSWLLWVSLILCFWLYGVYNAVKIVRIVFKNRNVQVTNKVKKYFFGIGLSELHSFSSNKHSIVSKAIFDQKHCNTLIVHDNSSFPDTSIGELEIKYSPLPVLEVFTYWKFFKYFFQVTYIIIRSFLSIVFGNWRHAVLLKEIALAKYVTLFMDDGVSSAFFFDQAKFIYRPFWTYEAARNGGEVILYFYSTNNEYIETKEFSYSIRLKWHIMNWPIYWVWNNGQEDFIKRVTENDSIVAIKGPILSGSNLSFEETQKISKPFVAVFDVQPIRSSFYKMLGLPQEYYVPEITVKFLTDIITCCNKYGIRISYKSKRNIGKIAHSKHRNLLAQMEHNKDISIIKSEISAQKLIEHSIGVISMPYTSTGLLGEESGKPSIYYDPTGYINKQSPASYSVPVISGIAELYLWVESFLKNSKE